MLHISSFLILWISFIFLFIGGALGLELIEGNKITTSEYYGLRNIGFLFLGIPFLIASILFPVIWWPLCVVIRKTVPALWGRIVIYFFMGAIGGIVMFRTFYNDWFIEEYHLNIGSSILIFGAAGICYAWLDRYLQRRESSWR